jgi:DNA-binding CsgD family transcriptional regulator
VRAALTPLGAASAAVDPPRIRVLSALAHLLARLADRCPVVVTLDDVHLGDGSSWEALNYLTRNLVDSGLLFVLVARPTELAAHPVASEVVRGLEQEGLLTRLVVGPLSRDEVRQVAAALVEGPVPDALVDWLVERAEGSPLFVTGLVRALLDEGADLAHPALRSLPEGLADRVEARLRRLDSQARATIEILTVIEHRVELSGLLRLTGHTLDELAVILEQLQRARLVMEVELGRELVYEVAHPLVQDAIYQHISGARRRALHRHVARELVESGRYGAAASHVVRAADPGDEEAIETLCEALRRAEAGEHHQEELALLDALLELLPAGDLRWLKVLGVLPLTPDWVVDHRADANSEVGVRAMRRAEQVLERSGDVAHQAAVKFSLGSLLAWGLNDLEPGRELVSRARKLFSEAGDERSVLVATNELGYHVGMADDGDEHERIATEVLAAAEQADDPALQLQALCSLAWALSLKGRIEPSLEVIGRGIDVARQADKTYRLCYLLGMGASLENFLGRSHHTAQLDAAKEMHPSYRDTLLLDFTAQIALQAGDLDGVVAAYHDQMAWDGGLSTRRAFGAAMAVQALSEMGRHGEAADILQTASAAFRGRRCWILSRLVDWAAGVGVVLSGGAEAGVARLAGVVEDAIEQSYWLYARWMLVDLAEAAVSGGDEPTAIRAAQLLRRDPCPPAGPSHDGARAFVTGAGWAAGGRVAEAVEVLRGAARDFGAAGWALYEGRSLELLGTTLTRLDRAQAVEALEAAADRFASCGASVRHQRTLARLEGLGPRGRRKKADMVGPGSLSAREREVAVLASEGQSAREIAARLFIGERTVETHLANVYAKLGVSSKVELVRRAAELGI